MHEAPKSRDTIVTDAKITNPMEDVLVAEGSPDTSENINKDVSEDQGWLEELRYF